MARCEEYRGKQQVVISVPEVPMDEEQLPYPALPPVVVALGLFGYLKSNWNKLDVLVISAEVLDYFLASLGIHTQVSYVFRPMRVISRVPSMRELVTVLSDILPMLANVLVLYAFVLHIFAVVGVQLWAGQLRNRCFLGEDIPKKYNVSLTPYFQPGEKSPFICSNDKNGMRLCQDVPPYTKDGETCSLVPALAGARVNGCVNWNVFYNVCRAGEDNPYMGAINFDNIGYALIAVFQVVTLEGWSEIMFYVMDAHSFWNFTFFLLVTIIGSFVMMNVCAVVIATHFSEKMKRKTQDPHAGIIMETCYKLVSWLRTIITETYDKLGSWLRRMCHRSYLLLIMSRPFTNIHCGTVNSAGSRSNRVNSAGSRRNRVNSAGSRRNRVNSAGSRRVITLVSMPYKTKLERIVNSKLFDLLIMLAVFLSVLTIAIEHHEQPKELASMLQISNIAFTLIFVVEMILKVLAFSWDYFRDRNNIFDFVIVIISLWEITSKAQGRLSVLRAFRLLRFLRLVHFLPYLKRQLEVLQRTMQEAAPLCRLLLFLTLIFSVIGMCLFGGKFNCHTQDESSINERKNFDSLLWSMVTVFQILTEEDWNLVLYNAMAVTSPWAALYFVAIIVLGKYVLLNVLVGIVVESFQAKDSLGSDQDSTSSTPSTQPPESQTENNETNDSSRPSQDRSLCSCWCSRPTAINSAPTDTNEDNRSLNFIQKVLFWCKEHKDWSLYVLSPQNRFRIFCQSLISHKMFDHAILLFILLSCVTIAMERPEIHPKSTERWILNRSSYIFSTVFLIEMLFKVLALGFVIEKGSYCRSPWNVMDGLLVILSLTHVIASLVSTGKNNMLGILKVLRLLRTLRPLRVIKRAPKLKLAVEALIASVKPISNIVLICCAFFFFFGVLGVQLFKGKFYHCVGEDIRNITNKADCLSANYQWVRKEYNFDSLPQALLALFVMYSRDGWVNIMYDGLDAVGVDQQPVRNHNEWMLLFFISFMVMSFLLLDMFIGVMVETFHQCQQEQRRNEGEEGGRILPDQRREPEQMPYYTYYSPIRKSIHALCTSTFLDLFMTVIIVMSVLVMACEHYNQPRYVEELMDYSWYVLIAILIIEVLLKFVAFGVLRFIKNSWNLLDLAVVLVSIFNIVLNEIQTAYEVPFNLTILRVCRVLRLAQVLKAKRIRVLLKMLIKTLSQVGNICLLFTFFFFIYAAMGVELFGKLECSDDHPCLGINRHVNFRHFGMALLALYQVCTGDNWSGILKDTLRECRPDDNGCLSYLSWVSPVFFTTFVIMAQFVLVNLVVAAIMQALEDSHKEENMRETEQALSSPE
ncbi:voltage-dependent T-type calcium channel subunit alpha-1H-like [Toxotes jaculatrix]|uniref:voltage-dependent T-type calcium channel subunit alpha-1H-like n=1 Tax=Toxotes jaculatrix TaxID=941984 RepID=UPI001B3AEBF5|nr:voltage-dependent T-type calcium channel subunit alpha-1H-like [Toxotes jaculatrix]